MLPSGVTLLPLLLSFDPKLILPTPPLSSCEFGGMQSSIPCIPPTAWPEENPPVGKNFGTNSMGGRPSDLGGVPTGPGSYVGVVQKETRKQHRSPEEVVRRRVVLARRCSRGSGRPYGSLAARAGQNQWLLTGHPRLATVKGRVLFRSGITIPFALLLVGKSLFG